MTALPISEECGSGCLLQRDLRAVGVGDDRADRISGFAVVLEQGERLVGAFGGDGEHHADAHVEDVVHLLVVDVAGAFQDVEDGKDGPGSERDVGGEAVGDHTGDVLDETAAGDVGDALDDACLE